MSAVSGHVQVVDAAGCSVPATPAVLQAVWFPLQAECPAALMYRVFAKAQSRHFTNVIVWAPVPPLDGFGEPGDLWVNHRALKIAICRIDYRWADIAQDREHMFACAHPMFPDLGLAFNGTSIQWYRKSARNKVRKDMRNLVHNELPQADILVAFWRGIAAYISSTPSSQDPHVYCITPSPTWKVQQVKQVFETSGEFLKFLPASTAGSPAPTLQAIPANEDFGLPAEVGLIGAGFKFTTPPLALIFHLMHSAITFDSCRSQTSSPSHRHMDASGAATWVSVGSGAKIWTLLTPRNDTTLIKNLQTAAMLPPKTHPGAFQASFHFSSLVLRPGALFIQPPGQLYMVYTPMKTIAVGGHFLMYDTLPHSLLTRRLARLTDDVATNFLNGSHLVVDRLLSRMALALTTRKSQKLGEWQFTALFELLLLAPVLFPTSPLPDTSAGKKRKRTSDDDFAEGIPSSRNRMTEAERERFAALQILRFVGEAVECPVTPLSLCPLRWRSTPRQELLELPSLPQRPSVAATDISALDEIYLHNRTALSKWMKEVKVKLRGS
ncbi:hypothetical protein C8Q76DRAFT_799359 [Earliella scabrosa]|nr:hypothetical protein C8Q76DRAFT_799359 [Earliella scabrosa]